MAPRGENLRINDTFNTWGEWLDAATQPPAGSANEARSYDGGHSWDLGAGFDGAVTLARDGWPKGLERVRKLSGALLARLTSQIARIEWTPDVTGHVLDVGAYVAGEPEHWYVAEEYQTEGVGQPVRIVFNAAASAGVDAETLAVKGSAVCALVEALSLAGRAVRVEAVVAVKWGDRDRADTRIVVKDYHAALDMDRLVFAIAHPAMLRRLWFAQAETWNDADRAALSIGGGYGIPCDTADQGDVYIPKSHLSDPQWSSPESALRWVREQLVKQGVALTPEREG